MNKSLKTTSKFLSLVLRHQPEKIGLTLDAQGWADVDELLALSTQHGVALSRDRLIQVVETNDKQRFAFNGDRTRIRANQGHSISVDLALEPQTPPDILFHGTATRFLDSIQAKGLISGSRQHVHLSADKDTAVKVGKRHGKPVVLTVNAAAMVQQGMIFFRSENGVWLTDHVPVECIEFPE
ncbi:MAG: RNA 2'-phosphotransferase [Cyanobacteria bacterium P01_F01_bin.150]